MVIFRSYLPYQPALRLRQRLNRFVLHSVNKIIEETSRQLVNWCFTSRQEVNDVQFDARLLSGVSLRELL